MARTAIVTGGGRGIGAAVAATALATGLQPYQTLTMAVGFAPVTATLRYASARASCAPA